MKMLLGTAPGALAMLVLMLGAQCAFAQLGAPHSKHPQAAYQSVTSIDDKVYRSSKHLKIRV
jgi:hypothetical protein